MYRFLEAGAKRLGPPPADGRDDAGVVLNDPFGAKLALMPARSTPQTVRVAWHLLSTRDETAAMELYAGILGWTPLDHQDLGERGRHVTFSWDGTSRPVGSACDIARRPHVHAQWLFFFPTSDLDASLGRVRELGGLTLPATTTPQGARVAAATTHKALRSGVSRRRGRHAQDVDHVAQIEPCAIPARSASALPICGSARSWPIGTRGETSMMRPPGRTNVNDPRASRSTLTPLHARACDDVGIAASGCRVTSGRRQPRIGVGTVRAFRPTPRTEPSGPSRIVTTAASHERRRNVSAETRTGP
jgi:predicted enzyme related to lactoylglutathione lyase